MQQTRELVADATATRSPTLDRATLLAKQGEAVTLTALIRAARTANEAVDHDTPPAVATPILEAVTALLEAAELMAKALANDLDAWNTPGVGQ